MTETARLAHYVLPAATQFEKPEATFFNFEFPRNGFHLRRPLLAPLPGTLPEPEIWARLVRALGLVDDADLRPLARRPLSLAAQLTPKRFSSLWRLIRLCKAASVRSLRNTRPTLPDGLSGAAALWGLAQKTAMSYPDAVHRAGHADGTRCSTQSSTAPPG